MKQAVCLVTTDGILQANDIGNGRGKLGKGRAFKALQPVSRSCTWPSKQAIPPSREQLPDGLGIRLMTREHPLRYALNR
jgi:hypothetical protein